MQLVAVGHLCELLTAESLTQQHPPPGPISLPPKPTAQLVCSRNQRMALSRRTLVPHRDKSSQRHRRLRWDSICGLFWGFGQPSAATILLCPWQGCLGCCMRLAGCSGCACTTTSALCAFCSSLHSLILKMFLVVPASTHTHCLVLSHTPFLSSVLLPLCFEALTSP